MPAAVRVRRIFDAYQMGEMSAAAGIRRSNPRPVIKKSGISGHGGALEKNFSTKYAGTCLMNNQKELFAQITRDCEIGDAILAIDLID
jgi:hypothetical protein